MRRATVDSHLVVGMGISSSTASANIIWYRRVLATTCCASESPCSSQNCRSDPHPRRESRQRARPRPATVAEAPNREKCWTRRAGDVDRTAVRSSNSMSSIRRVRLATSCCSRTAVHHRVQCHYQPPCSLTYYHLTIMQHASYTGDALARGEVRVSTNAGGGGVSRPRRRTQTGGRLMMPVKACER